MKTTIVCFFCFENYKCFINFEGPGEKVIELHSHRSGRNLGLHVRYHLKKNCYKLRLSNAKTNNIGILIPNLFWPTLRKNCFSGREKLLKFEAEGREFAKILRLLEQFIQKVSERSKQFLKQNAFLTCSWQGAQYESTIIFYLLKFIGSWRDLIH